ncbi:RloF protein [Burkholderia pseudomallei]|nr:RloF protein [Burkholderia pseudomallei]
MRLEIPMFQRQYVWSREHQWEPLWEDISRKFSEFIEGRKDAPVHFLGAMVLDQKQTQTGRVERRSVIDGQQRLTTLQIFLAAFRDFCREEDLNEFADECEKFTLNSGRMAEPEIEQFKVWPTLSDREQFRDVLTARSKATLEKMHPLTRRPYARKYDPRPRMVEAYLFFYEQLLEFFKGGEETPPLAQDIPLPDRLEECFEALKTALKVVAIDLDRDDDAQVIFETLNARGEPLLPADLLRNYIFLRAARQGEAQEDLYKQHWAEFDEEFWREEVTQGRLRRPRSDLFIQHFLASKQARDIPIKHLFVEYKYWVERARPFEKVHDELMSLAKQRSDFRRISVPNECDVLGRLAHFLNVFDVSTAYPPLLALLDQSANDTEMARTAEILESYLVRRAICGADTKAYNRMFMGLTRTVKRDGAKADVVFEHLAALRNPTDEWPSDEAFSRAWTTRNAYAQLNNMRITYVLGRINETYRTSKTEAIRFDAPVTVEHLMPQGWIENWPLPDGSRGVDPWSRNEDEPGVQASQRRDSLVHTFGNLTLITGSLNSSIKNGRWEEKRPEILTHSLLPINGQLHQYDVWNEEAIIQRGKGMLERALKIWPRG